MEGWTIIMYIYMDAYNSVVVIFYYISCIVVCSLFLLNLTVAVMLGKYEELDDNEESADIDEIKDEAKKIKLPPKLIKFIIENDMVMKKPKKAGNDEEEEETFFIRAKKLWKSLLTSPPIPKDSYYQAPIVYRCFKITTNPLFQAFIMFIILLNTIILAMDKYPAHGQET